MNQTLETVFDGKVFRPAEAVELEPNTTVEIVITVKSVQRKNEVFSLHGAFAEIAGTERFFDADR